MKDAFDKNPACAARGIWFLYGATFAMAIALSVLWTTMPFIVRNIGGSEDHVGYAWAVNMVGYMVCLLVAGVALGQHNPKNTTRLAAIIIFVTALIMGIVVYAIITKGFVGNLVLIWTLIIAGLVAGAAMSLFWPFLMNWISEDLEGTALNSRFGTYNCMWSGAAIIGPIISGILVEANTLFPVLFAIAGSAICFLFLSVAVDSSIHMTLFGDEIERPVAGCENRASLMRFRWMARIALFSSWACLGVTRSQFALLFTGIGFSETWFGIIITIFGIFNFTVMMAAGKCVFWHFKPILLPAVQVLLSVSLVLIIYGQSLPVFILAFVVMGCGFGFAYSSHLYYGACGTKKRSVQMVIHEATISIGIIVGSGAGGYFARNVGLYFPYWFALVLLAAGLLAQLAILLYHNIIERKFTKLF
jgi:MFS family permease